VLFEALMYSAQIHKSLQALFTHLRNFSKNESSIIDLSSIIITRYRAHGTIRICCMLLLIQLGLLIMDCSVKSVKLTLALAVSIRPRGGGGELHAKKARHADSAEHILYFVVYSSTINAEHNDIK
jgi:hypothetical protein